MSAKASPACRRWRKRLGERATVIVLAIGIAYAVGTWRAWPRLSARRSINEAPR